MSGIFLKLLNLSISASWLVLVVLALRLVLKRAPRSCSSIPRRPSRAAWSSSTTR